MGSRGAPGSGSLGHFYGPVKNHSLHAGVLRALLDDTCVDFLEETRDGGGDGGMDFEESLGDGFDSLDVGQSCALKDIDVIERAAIDVGEWKERERDVLC